MANNEQLMVLLQGSVAWNKWRAEDSDAQIDLREADLREVNLCGANLVAADFREANLIGAALRGADSRDILLACRKRKREIGLIIPTVVGFFKVHS